MKIFHDETLYSQYHPVKTKEEYLKAQMEFIASAPDEESRKIYEEIVKEDMEKYLKLLKG